MSNKTTPNFHFELCIDYNLVIGNQRAKSQWIMKQQLLEYFKLCDNLTQIGLLKP